MPRVQYQSKAKGAWRVIWRTRDVCALCHSEPWVAAKAMWHSGFLSHTYQDNGRARYTQESPVAYFNKVESNSEFTWNERALVAGSLVLNISNRKTLVGLEVRHRIAGRLIMRWVWIPRAALIASTDVAQIESMLQCAALETGCFGDHDGLTSMILWVPRALSSRSIKYTSLVELREALGVHVGALFYTTRRTAWTMVATGGKVAESDCSLGILDQCPIWSILQDRRATIFWSFQL